MSSTCCGISGVSGTKNKSRVRSIIHADIEVWKEGTATWNNADDNIIYDNYQHCWLQDREI